MLEAHAFFAVFTLQILIISLLHPLWFIRYLRARALSFPAERFAALYPGVDRSVGLERFLARYRVLNVGIAALGLAFLAGFVRYMQRPDWDDGPVEALLGVFFAVQMVLPFSVLIWSGFRYQKLLAHALGDGKRRALLQRRTLFDFVSPLIVTVAVASYVLFVAFVLHIQQDPFPGFSGYITLATVTLVYAVNAFGVYTMLYGRRQSALETHAERARAIGLGVKACFYSSIACVAFLSLNFTLVLLDLQRWEPSAQSAFFIICSVIVFMSFSAPPEAYGSVGSRSAA